jgi:hypothetical protein
MRVPHPRLAVLWRDRACPELGEGVRISIVNFDFWILDFDF